MKKIILPLALALFASAPIFTGCESSAQKVENAEQNVADAQTKLDKVRQDSIAEYEKTKAEWTARVAKNDQAIADYKIKVAKENKVQREKDEAKLDELQEKNNAMRTNITGYKSSEESNWTDFKEGFKKMTDDFDEEMTEFANSVGKAIDKK